MQKLAWQNRAACRGMQTDIFFPATDEEALVAKEVCDGCPVSETCLEHALTSREREGIWGGATERDRRRIIRQRRKAS